MKQLSYILSCVIIAAYLVLNGCAVPTQISDLKTEKWRDYIGKEITLKGFFVDRPVPMLVTTMDVLLINSPIPEEDYIRLKGDPLKDLDPNEY